MSLSELKRVVEGSAEKIRVNMTEPDEDWQCVMLLLDGDGDILPAPIQPIWLQSERGKTMLAEHVLPGAIRLMKAEAFALVLTTWTIWRKKSEIEPGEKLPLPSTQADRQEKLMAIYADQHNHEVRWANIVRTETVPEPLEWEDCAFDWFEGRFFDAPMQALRGL